MDGNLLGVAHLSFYLDDTNSYIFFWVRRINSLGWDLEDCLYIHNLGDQMHGFSYHHQVEADNKI